jgi:hypothetical protein
MPNCPACNKPVEGKRKHCNSKCRMKAYRIRKIDKLLAEFKKILVEELG